MCERCEGERDGFTPVCLREFFDRNLLESFGDLKDKFG